MSPAGVLFPVHAPRRKSNRNINERKIFFIGWIIVVNVRLDKIISNGQIWGKIVRMNDQLPVFQIRDLDFYYGPSLALNQINMDIQKCKVTALIGPSGCGKSTFLRCLNRMNDTIPGTRVVGEILLEGKDIYAADVDLPHLRQRVGMVYQKPNPFPQSIYDNVAFGPRVVGIGLLIYH